MEDFGLKISQFIDGELNVEEQKELFTKLSTDDELRDLFNDQIQLRNKMKEYYSQIEYDDSIYQIKQNRFKTAFYISAAASVFLLSLLSFNYLNEERNDKFQPVREEISKLQPTADYKFAHKFDMDFEFYTLNKQLEILKNELERDPL